jgi:hypothetical protein
MDSFENSEKNKFILVISILFIIVAIVLTIYFWPESFISGGTLNQLVSVDSQDLYLHGNELRKYTNGQFNMPYDLPTRMYNINRGYLTNNPSENINGAYLGNEYIAPIPDIMKPL